MKTIFNNTKLLKKLYENYQIFNYLNLNKFKHEQNQNFKSNRKGMTTLLVLVVFLVLVFSFVAIMVTFIDYSGSRTLIYEQSYAKQIALIIDNSRPEMAVLLDVSEGLEVAKKQDVDLSKSFVLKDGRVLVDLGRSGGYSYEYFSDYDIDLKLVGNQVSIGVRSRMGEEVVEEEVGGVENA